MLFTFYALDAAGKEEDRLRERAVHIARLGTLADRIAFAGPMLNDDGSRMVGTLLVIDFPDKAAAEAWIGDDVFVRQGIYESVQIRPFENLWPQRAGFPPPR